MNITVAICTWNRCALLKETLERVARLRIPTDIEWELLVVNNNSTDATAETLAAFTSRLPLRTVFESEPGLSNARNRAVSEARGEYILWTDDDVLVDEQWLAAYAEAFKSWPDAAVFGGNIEPWFEGEPPVWLPRVWARVASAYASRDLGDESIALSTEVIPFGANFAVRAREQREYLYDPRLGVRPDNIMGGEETTVIRKMLSDGLTGRWVPQARVRHYIPRARQSIEYLRKYFKGYGEYCARQDADNKDAKLFGRPRWLWREAVASELKYHVRRRLSKPEVWIEDLIASSQARGQLTKDWSN
ncbi:MAG: glycosyltransferase family 2 protein [Acidobacteria bacterium]|nr:glycosyltransferase family 2 protein [Acidobacteriota bacterium]